MDARRLTNKGRSEELTNRSKCDGRLGRPIARTPTDGFAYGRPSKASDITTTYTRHEAEKRALSFSRPANRSWIACGRLHNHGSLADFFFDTDATSM
ncbi:unnamed protein product [Caenorhabditis auriculariae]|uniref:Uncharacterized protein n=1 Tax=Caenorhabditis auriculariae TaxID=2777116 RepID=A0A8S1HJY1_9PELO|nr:unnamed protein product [Caenorhabditis auriculariae]